MGKYKFESTEHELFRKTLRKFLAEEAEVHYDSMGKRSALFH
ncbi:hypothetical protein LSPH24S_05960 [Lysinibacillus sphaericus]